MLPGLKRPYLVSILTRDAAGPLGHNGLHQRDAEGHSGLHQRPHPLGLVGPAYCSVLPHKASVGLPKDP